MAEFSRLARPLVCRGIQLSKPVDQLDEGKFAKLLNARSVQENSLQSRQGSSALNAMAALSETDVHSIRRLNDPLPGATNPFIRVVGAGTKVFAGVTPANPALVTGFSGNPISLVPYRPPSSPESWMYIGDSSKMVKVNPDAATTANMGGAPPLTAPTTALAGPSSILISDFEALGAWTPGGTAGAIGVGSRLSGATTIAANGIVYDTGATGWASIAPTILDANVRPGMLFIINAGGGSAETVIVESIQRASVLVATTIAAITYDTGTTGLCTVQMSTPNPLLERNSMIRFAGGTAETVRVLSVTSGPDGLSSFRCSTAHTHAAAEALTGFASFRAYCANTHAAAETLTTNCFSSAITTGTGYLNLVAAFDLSNVGGRPIQNDDILHISIRTDAPQNLTEARVQLDFDSATNDFTRNYFWKAFRQSDLQAAVSQTQTVVATQQVVIQRGLIDQYAFDQQQLANDLLTQPREVVNPSNGHTLNPTGTGQYYDPQTGDIFSPLDLATMLIGPPPAADPVTIPTAPDTGTTQTVSDQAISGGLQWNEFVFRASELTRVGGDYSRGLKDIAAVRITFIVTGATAISVDAFYVRGAYGPDVEDIGQPLIYRHRARSSKTGVVTNPGPPTRYGEKPQRNRVVVTPPLHPDSQFDKLDIERFGGVNLGWHEVGSCDNTGTPSFNDDYPDLAIQGAPPFELDNHQPFPMIDSPKSGTCNVSGTAVTRTGGDTFSTSWARAIIININGVNYTTYSSPGSTSFLELNENAGSLSAVKWFILEPILIGQPLPCLWGPHPLINVIFGAGSTYQPGTIFWTKQDNADAAPTAYQQEVTPPSEVLMNGVMLPDGSSYVWSTERYFAIYPSLNALDKMTIIEAGKRGLYAKWFLCAGEGKLWWGDKDGIYESDGGGDGVSITNEDLYPLFPHDGIAGVTTNGYVPPDMTALSALRLSYENGWVIFDYTDTGGAKKRLCYRVRDKSWWPDIYPQNFRMAYREEGQGVESVLFGAGDGKLYVSGGTQDAGANIAWQVRTKSDDAGDSRPDKLWGDVAFDIDCQSINVVVTPGFDNYATTAGATTFANAARPGATLPVMEFTAGSGKLARNLALDFAIARYGPVLYQWLPSLISKPEDTTKRGTDWEDFGAGEKWIQGCVIECDTSNVARTIQVQYDGGTVGATLTVQHNGQVEKPYGFTPIYAHSVRLVPTDSNPWRFFKIRWILADNQELKNTSTKIDDVGAAAAKYVRGCVIEADTVNLPVSVQVIDDTGAVQATLSLTHNGQSEIAYAFTPFVAHEMRLNQVAASDVWRFYKVRWIYDEYPELAAIYSPWGDSDYAGEKFVQGCIIEADTANAAVSVQIQGDGGAVMETLSLTHNGDVEKPYSFTPFFAHNLRLVPLGPVRIFKVRWVWEPSPELTETWVTQPTTHDIQGFKHLRCDGYVALISTAVVTLAVTVDGVVFTYSIPSTAGIQVKVPISFQVMKGMLYTYSLTSPAGFRLFRKDSEIGIREWGSDGPYQIVLPFGDESRLVGAKI